MAPTEGNARLLAMYDQASRDLGLGTVTAVALIAPAPLTFRSSRPRWTRSSTASV